MPGARKPLLAGIGYPAAHAPIWRRALFVGLAAAGVLPPIALAGLPGVLAALGRLHMAAAAMGLLILAPASVALAAEFKRLDAPFAAAAVAAAGELRLALLRVLAAAAILAYAFGLAVLLPDGDALGPCLVVALLAVASAWLFLLHLICRPGASTTRHYLAMTADIALLSGFLDAGGGLTAAWYPAYLGIALANGLGFEFGAFLFASAASAAGFAVVVATTPFWRQQGILSGGLILALLLLPAELFLLMRGQAAKMADREEGLAPPPEVLDRCDLAGRAVLIASEDAEFAGGLAARLRGWRGDVRITALSESALGETLDDLVAPPVLIVDGRGEMLAALSLAYRAASACAAGRPHILFVAEAAAAEGLLAVGGDFLAAILRAPLTAPLLAAALRALPQEPALSRPRLRPPPPLFAERPARGAEAAADPPEWPAEPAPSVTPIASHPRFAGDNSPIIDEAVVAALEGLGSGRDFLGALIEVFRGDAQDILQALGAAALAAEPSRFKENLHALKGCAANVGGLRLCELLQSIRDMTASDLRREGAALVQRVGAEVARLDAALRAHLDNDAARDG